MNKKLARSSLVIKFHLSRYEIPQLSSDAVRNKVQDKKLFIWNGCIFTLGFLAQRKLYLKILKIRLYGKMVILKKKNNLQSLISFSYIVNFNDFCTLYMAFLMIFWMITR